MMSANNTRAHLKSARRMDLPAALLIVQWIVGAFLMLWLEETRGFGILHRSRSIGTDWIGPAWSVLLVPLIATAIALMHRFGDRQHAASLRQQELRRRLVLAEQCLASLVLLVVLYWNIVSGT